MRLKSGISMIVAAALVGAASAQDGSIRFDGGGVGNGGAFDMTVISGISGTGLTAGDTFQTFCLELTENIAPGNTYNVRVNDRAVGGGQFDSDGDAGNGGDLLSAQTAFLFSNFWHGTLAGFTNDNDSERGLQLAIWELEEGIDSQTAFNATANARAKAAAFLAAANAAVLGGSWSGLGDVRVLNLGNPSTYANQDMLVVIPLPQAGALAGLGLVGLAVRRRRGL